MWKTVVRPNVFLKANLWTDPIKTMILINTSLLYKEQLFCKVCVSNFRPSEKSAHLLSPDVMQKILRNCTVYILSSCGLLATSVVFYCHLPWIKSLSYILYSPMISYGRGKPVRVSMLSLRNAFLCYWSSRWDPPCWASKEYQGSWEHSLKTNQLTKSYHMRKTNADQPLLLFYTWKFHSAQISYGRTGRGALRIRMDITAVC